MKKLIIFVCTFVLALSLTACSTDSTMDNNRSDNNASRGNTTSNNASNGSIIDNNASNGSTTSNNASNGNSTNDNHSIVDDSDPSLGSTVDDLISDVT